MKIKYYLFLLLVFCGQFSNANSIGNRVIWSSSYLEKVNDPVIPPLPNLQMCDDNNDGFTSFNLTIQTPIILASQSTEASNYSISYHITATDAITSAFPISNTSSHINLSNPQTIYTRVQNNITLQYEVGSFQLIVNALPTLIAPPDFSTCDSDGLNDGYYSFSLSSLIPSILGQSQNPSNYSVTFYDTLANAQSNTNAISNLVNYQAYTHTIWIRVSNSITGCYIIGSFNTTVEQLPQPIILANSPTLCVDFATNSVVAPVTLTAVNTTNYLIQNPQTSYLFQWFDDGIPIFGAVASTYTISSPIPNSISSNYSVEMISNSILGCAAGSTPFIVFQSGSASPIGIGYSIANNSGNQVITVEVSGYGTYQYQLDNGPQQSSTVFSNVTLGNHTITISDVEGCGSILIDNINVNLIPTPPPSGNAVQSFNQGATLANMQVTGQNIQWYSGANKNFVSSPLPLNTLLVDGITYFASQKIGGYESTTRLPVTAQIVLANADFELSGLLFAPNPVSNILKIKSNEVINEVSVYNFLGQIVLNKKIVGNEIEIDLTSLNASNYFVKVQSGNKNSNFKIAKY